MWSSKGWWLAVLCLTCGCSSVGTDDSDGGSGSLDVASGPMSGKIGGKSWTFKAGETDSFLSEDEDFWADLYDEQLLSACQGVSTTSNDNHLILNIPKQTGDYKLSLSLNATFVIEGAETDNQVATRGRLVVDEVTSTSIRGKAHVVLDADNEVNGAFQIAVCP